jgi:predicted transposase/invertase (TIGR01784 family)
MSETTLLDIQSDYIFKRVFGVEKNKKLLISLINSILKGNPTVTDLEIRNTEISKILKNNLTIYLDIKAERSPQEFVDIEIQVRNTGEIMERAVQYLAEILTLNCRKLTEEERRVGQRQTYKYPKVIGIWIMGENVTDREDAVNEACVAFPPTERDKYQIITDKLRIFFVELQKFHPKHIDRKNMLDVWMAFLKNPLNDEIQDVPEVKEALNTLKEISSDRDEREIYYLRQHTEFGYLSEKNEAIQKALKKEREKAFAEKIESAGNLLKAGVSLEIVANSLGLSLEEVKKVKN